MPKPHMISSESGSPQVRYRNVYFQNYSLEIICLFIFKIYLFFIIINTFFLAALGLRCCARAFSSCGEQGLLFIAVASLVVEPGL